MNKNTSILVGAVVVILLVVGGFAIFHKSSKTTASTTTSQSQKTAVNNTVLETKSNSSLGQYLASAKGMALYTYGGDTSGVSNCKGSCLSSWPAYVDTGSTTNLPQGVGTIKRSDNGQTQYTYNGKPLYTFVGDSNGSVTGNGVSNFAIATPAAATSSQSSTPAPASSSSQSNSGSSSSYAY